MIIDLVPQTVMGLSLGHVTHILLTVYLKPGAVESQPVVHQILNVHVACRIPDMWTRGPVQCYEHCTIVGGAVLPCRTVSLSFRYSREICEPNQADS